MIFSGQVRDYKCPACAYETQAQYSTAIPYWFGLLALSCAVLFPVIRHRFGPHHGGYGLLVIIADIALLALLISSGVIPRSLLRLGASVRETVHSCVR